MNAYIDTKPIFMSMGDKRYILCNSVVIRPRKETLPMKSIAMNLCCTMYF